MSATGATGPAPNDGNIAGAVTAKFTDPTDLEILESRRQAEQRAARLGISPKNTNGATPAAPFPVGETIDTGIVAAVTAKQAQRPVPVASKETNSAANVIPHPRNPTLHAGNNPIDAGLVEAAETPRAKEAAAKRQQNERPGANAGPAKPSEQQPRPDGSQASSEQGARLGKPSPLKPEFENFPAELKSLPNWVLWRYLSPKSHGQKWRKVPFQPNKKPADTTDRATWSTFEDCYTAYAQGGFAGVGFVFDGEIGTDGLCYCGVDFDACSIKNGKEVYSLAVS